MNRRDLDCLAGFLPKHPNILDKGRFFNAAVLIPLVEQDGELHFLFQKRAAHIRQGGEICFPGGEHEPGSDASCKETALRETEEELGVSRDRIEVLGRLDTFVSPRGITVDSFPAVLDIAGLEDLNLDTNEVERVFLLPVSWFEENAPEVYRLRLEIKPSYQDASGQEVTLLPVEELGLPSRYLGPWTGLEHKVFIYRTPVQEVIWGITAELIQGVLSALRLARGEST
jgi:8-oxo-dGTP pyrophosphatase MutT (NUDIX family)